MPKPPIWPSWRSAADFQDRRHLNRKAKQFEPTPTTGGGGGVGLSWVSSGISCRSFGPRAIGLPAGDLEQPAGMNVARAACQNRLCTNAVRHHSRQRARVRRHTPKSCDSRATRGGVAPCSIAEINTIIVARYTRRHRNRSDGGVLHWRHLSTAAEAGPPAIRLSVEPGRQTSGLAPGGMECAPAGHPLHLAASAISSSKLSKSWWNLMSANRAWYTSLSCPAIGQTR